MRRALVVAACLLTAALATAGCFGADAAPNERKASASGGRITQGWAYDGAGIETAGATLDASFLNAENVGEAIAEFQFRGATWSVIFNEFAQAEGKAFMDGGIAFDLVEHGDSGTADASIPKILALVAAWGTASVSRDGVPVVGEKGNRWSAHIMVSGTTVRDASGKITKADGAAPYDPTAPGDARRVENDPQVLLKLVHPDGETAARAPIDVAQTFEILPPSGGGTIEIPYEGGAARIALNVTAMPTQAGIGAGSFVARLVDADGSELGVAEGNIQGPTGSTATIEAAPSGAGPLSLFVSGEGALTVDVVGKLEYEDTPFLVVTWDDVTVA